MPKAKAKNRRPAINSEEFTRRYVDAVRDGITNTEFAKRIGVSPSHAANRTSKLRAELEKRGKVLPALKPADRKVKRVNYDAIMDIASDILTDTRLT